MGPSKLLKQIIQIEHNIAKNLNWPEANQWAIYKVSRGFELWAAEKQIQVVVRAGFDPGTPDHWATLPPIPLCLMARSISLLHICAKSTKLASSLK